jgi:diguanylate cyclase (GGDEF)-like protein
MNRPKVLIILAIVLVVGFVTTSFFSYHVSKQAIHKTIVDNELPLTADNIYSEIQKDLVRPVFISSMMASDTFLRDWVIEGEQGIDKISKYLQQVQTTYGAFVSFLVTERTHNYYYGEGILKQVKQDEPRDAWYFRVRDLRQPYEINVDKDLAHHDELTIFVNYRVLDYSNRFIGTVGIGLNVDSVQKLIASYQKKYQRDVYFVSHDGTIMLSGSQRHAAGKNIKDVDGMSSLPAEIIDQPINQANAKTPREYEYEYEDYHANHLINVRYIPELKWYLFVEKSETQAISGIRNTLILNLLVCLAVTLIVVAITDIALKRYQQRLEVMATTDILTGLPNRRAFDIVIEVMSNDNARSGGTIAILVLDIDHFKAINDQYGHIGGDYVLTEVASIIKSSLRAADFICRWGGEEFLVVVRDCDQHNIIALAEKVRKSVEHHITTYQNQTIALTVSIGAAIGKPSESLENLVVRADKAMYQAKKQGRNRSILS